ncbi:MAG: hypothetical protein Q9227_000630 [Pyrenula ochraceoflavens]
MATNGLKQWGTTPPISMALPTAADNAANDNLISELKRQNNYEPQHETDKRVSTLKLLYECTLEFVRQASRKKGYSENQIKEFGGRVFAYGSYRLGVFGPGSDIDTLVVAPKHIYREDFFEFFPSVLEQKAPKDSIGWLTPVPEAFVPIIKMELCGIEIDLIFARIASLQVVPRDLDLRENKYLQGLDERELRSVNGTRVTDEILGLVPQVKTFRTALRAVKLWAQRRAIYANIMGFPGGVAWAMLVARVCQLYPQATGSTIIHKFFTLIGQWNWPSPIMLKQIETGTLKVWNPQLYPGDRKGLMPIITPAYPSMNSTFNISKSGKEIITKELKRGGQIAAKILANQLQWKDLFSKHTFFTRDHKYYLSVVASSNDKDASLAWSGMVESKVRILVMRLEDLVDLVDLARPFTKGFERVHKCKNDSEVDEVKKGSVKYQAAGTKAEVADENDPQRAAAVQDGVALNQSSEPKNEAGSNGSHEQTIYTTTFYIGLDIKGKGSQNSPGTTDIPLDGMKTFNISWPISNFRDTCTSWANYDENLHELTVTPIRNYDLPEDLFDKGSGEMKPTRPKKKTSAPTGKKRSFQETQVRDSLLLNLRQGTSARN